MLTPLFDIKQDSDFVVISARCPYIKATEIEIHVDGHDFKLYAKPYFLSLHLPGEVLEDERAKAHYDVDTSQVVVTLPKKTPGEFFEDLGMLTKLLTPGKSSAAAASQEATKSLVEVIGGKEEGAIRSEGEEKEVEEEEEEEWDWRVEQTVPEENTGEPSLLSSGVSYGFADRYSSVFQKLQGEIPDLVDVPDPDHTPPRERHLARLANEDESFNAEHYLADMMDNGYIQDVLLPYQPPWYKELREWEEQQRERETLQAQSTSPGASGGGGPSRQEPGEELCKDEVPFSPDQRYRLKNLPRREYLLDKEEEHSLYLGLVDIVFAYAYNHRTTEGENTVESAWTICKLSSTMSWLEKFTGSVQEVVLSSIRRSLAFPLFRHWQLSLATLEDTRALFRLGRQRLLQCLLEVHQLLASSDPFYVFNDLYITDYCVWLQGASARRVHSLAKQLDKLVVTKEEVGWELGVLEEAARLVAMEEGEDSDTEGSGDNALPQEEGGVGTPPEEGVQASTLPEEEDGAGTPPEEGVQAGTPPEEEGGAGTPPEEGGAGTPPEEGGVVTHPEEGRTDVRPKEQSGGDVP